MEYVKISSLIESKIIQTITPSFKLQKNELEEFGSTPVISQEKDFINGYTNKHDKQLENGPFVIFGDHTECLKFVKFPFVQGADGIKIMKTDQKQLDPYFLYYSLCAYYNKTGFYERHFKLLRRTLIPKLDLAQQTKIASILSNYDELIEKNNRKIEILQEMAEELYKEWFVRFRFHGYETAKFTDGIPDGWETKPLQEWLTECFNGGWGDEISTQKTPYGAFVIRGTDIENVKKAKFNDTPYRYHKQNDIKTKLLKENDIVLELSNGNINNIGRTLFINKQILDCFGKVMCASFCKTLRFKNKKTAFFVWQYINYLQNSGLMLYYKNTGSNGINNFNFKRFLKMPISIPNDLNCVDYLMIYYDAISLLSETNYNLYRQRDLLLPRLMSGKLEVKGDAHA